MEQKTSSDFIYHLFLFFFSFKMFTTKMATAQKVPIFIKVGLVLDKDEQMGLNCISMGLSDFYARHDYYKTRLLLFNRDSRGDVVGAAAAVLSFYRWSVARKLVRKCILYTSTDFCTLNAALDLVKNIEVQAIIGPLYSVQANFMIAIGDKAQVPIITYSATNPSLSSTRSPYFIRATLNDSNQVHAISAIIQAYGWREVVLIYEDNLFGEGIIPFLTDALEKVNARVPYRSIIPSLATDDQIVAELYKLMTMQTRVFVIHMLTSLGSRLFTKAKQLGMMSEEYVWIITDGIANELNSLDPSVLESMVGVIGVKPYTPKTKELDDFTIRYKKMTQQNNPKVLSPDLNIYGLWAYDTATALAMAAEEARLGINSRFGYANVSRNSTDLEAFGVSNAGPMLVHALSNTSFKGLAGNFRLVDGQLQAPPYQIINMVGPGARGIGYWTKENGIVKDLNFTSANAKSYSTSKSVFGTIIWPGDRTSPAKGWVIPTNGKKLRIGVPLKDGFAEFVSVTWNSDNSTVVKGYCIDVFEAVMKKLPYGVPYEYIPFATPDHYMAGSYNDLTYQNYDAVVGDVTIVANRSLYVDFTLPYTESGVSMVVPIKDDKSKNAWVFLKPLTWELWLTSFCSFVFIGFLIWILEHRINEDFRGPFWYQVGMIFWFAFSTMVFAHKERVISNLARFVLIIWFLVVLILTQSYTASLTSMLTVQKLQPTVTDVNDLISNREYVGYKNGSFVYGLLIKMRFDESNLVAFNSPEQMDELLTKGSKNGGISAAFHEIPYLKLFLAKYCSKYMMVDPVYKAGGFGFVSILNVTEGKILVEIETTWLGNKIKCPDSNTLLAPKNLGLASFWGLFLIVGIAGVLAFVIYVIKFLRENLHVIEHSNPDSTTWDKILVLCRRFDNKDLTSHTFKNISGDREIALMDSPLQSPSSFSMASPCTCTNVPPSPIFSSPISVQNNTIVQGSNSTGNAVVNQEIELVMTNENEQLNSTLGHAVQ
ncbi:hypothetical protein ACJIZ3_004327 [Penstemon smallii]|uniref:Ionotropic glutamate receptor C-terminal domain-containing protein n=1 Tax=Penstemon smallii TaxID=265156 RepID=A0ABD3S1W7_9LAMI